MYDVDLEQEDKVMRFRFLSLSSTYSTSREWNFITPSPLSGKWIAATALSWTETHFGVHQAFFSHDQIVPDHHHQLPTACSRA